MTNTGGPVVHLLCGYSGAGKTTHAKHLEKVTMGVRFSLDEWMIQLHPELSYQSQLYGIRAEACKWVIWDVALQFLQRGVDVILDWNQWSRVRRSVWRDAAESAGFNTRLHFVDVRIETALHRSANRAADRTAGSHRLAPEDVRSFVDIFEPPSPDEGIPLTVIP
ncbi:ATP-binding protein [Paenarthrobacter sp. Z7-10]|uniref:AAA family ATPase n=1 Tax=Paenarthrobacter sp. Z7-10 TaxID=2787635 RepID=UPI0022A9D6F1|nr:ATP-binding protein [Paenarthrobacter sp. Z7-10]MCZ2404874.1 ATP-binding protein [Paenarthrobacter sp. Z7-10]